MWSNDDRAKILLAKAYRLEVGLFKLSAGSGTVVLLVHGIDPSNSLSEWDKPFTKLLDLDKNVYMHRWSKFVSLKKNEELLLTSIRMLLKTYPNEELIIIGHSAGGAIALLAKDSLTGTKLDKRIYLHTIATPLFGYGAPFLAHLGTPFVGGTTIAMGLGIYKKLKHKHLNQCTHWVNSNCLLDHHTCDNSKRLSPELGELNGWMPGGIENTHYFNDEDHLSIISRAIDNMVI